MRACVRMCVCVARARGERYGIERDKRAKISSILQLCCEVYLRQCFIIHMSFEARLPIDRRLMKR